MAETSTKLAGVAVIAGVIGTLLGATVAPYVNYLTNERQMDVKMVELGIGILREPPKEGIEVMRSWAVDVIEANSKRKFSPQQRQALEKTELPVKTPVSWPASAFDRTDGQMPGLSYGANNMGGEEARPSQNNLRDSGSYRKR